MVCPNLPPEIIAHIVSFFQAKSWPPSAPNPQRRRLRVRLISQQSEVFEQLHEPHSVPADRDALCALRLVNRDWHAAATRELFKRTRLRIIQTPLKENGYPVDLSSDPVRPGWTWLEDNQNWMHDSARSAIRHVILDFKWRSYPRGDGWIQPHLNLLQHEVFTHKPDPLVQPLDLSSWQSYGLPETIRWPDAPPERALEAARAALQAFPSTLAALPGSLTTLDVRLPALSWWSGQPQEYDHPIELNQDVFRDITEALISLLSNDTALPTLSDLRLSLTGTRDFADLADAVPATASVWQKLQRLYLAVTDASGFGGKREYAGHTGYIRVGLYGPDQYQRTSLQRDWPNRQHGASMFEIASRCTNLKSLGLDATHLLDGDEQTAWIDILRGKLEVLLLSRIEFSYEMLMSLLKLPSDAEQHLWFIHLNELVIKTNHGSWEDVFVQLQKYSSLRYCHVMNLGYATHYHERHQYSNRPDEDSSTIWSADGRDEEAYERLRAIVRDSDGCAKDEYDRP